MSTDGTTMMDAPCVLASGGMDSFLAWRLFRPDAINVFIDIRQPYAGKESNALAAIKTAYERTAKPLAPPFITMSLSGGPFGRDPMPSGIILHRNALLILAAARLFNDITMGVLADEINSDKSPEFLSAMETVLNISHRGQYWNGGHGVTYNISTPTRDYTKSELVAEYLAQGHPTEPLLATVSCYADDSHGKQCGACPSCFKRWVALTNNGLPGSFTGNPARWGVDNGILRKAMDGTYGERRANEIKQAYQKAGYDVHEIAVGWVKP